MSLKKDEARRRKKARTISVERSKSSGFFAEDGAQTSSDCGVANQYVTTLELFFLLKQVKASRKHLSTDTRSPADASRPPWPRSGRNALILRLRL
jgi:hypothetical protein